MLIKRDLRINSSIEALSMLNSIYAVISRTSEASILILRTRV
jgi:hypothetical protein